MLMKSEANRMNQLCILALDKREHRLYLEKNNPSIVLVTSLDGDPQS